MSRIKEFFRGTHTSDGAGVKLKRVFGFSQVPKLDPYLMLDFFDSHNPSDYTAGFPWHPHRGIDTVTFLFSGNIAHEDSLGNKGIISSRDCQWMTAGSGIIHQEMPLSSEHMLGIQLWVNLPRSHKMMEPRYREIKNSEIPTIKIPGAIVHVLAGNFNNCEGPIQRSDINATFLDVTLEAGSQFEYTSIKDHTVFTLLINGSAAFDTYTEEVNEAGCVILYENGTDIRISSSNKPARFLLVSGKPINEPVAWRGPIVMNTKDELDVAFREYNEGTFIKSKPSGA